jgi:enamine deaminase RidA (YjgF/YER057c/UK114 family)
LGVRITRLHLEELHPTAGYSHVTIIDAGRLAVLAGQCPLDLEGQLVGPGDVLAQTDQVVTNSAVALAAAGTSPDHVIRSVIYVVSDDPATLASVWDRLTVSPLSAAFTTASTLVGVAALGYRDQLVELDLTAALPA